MPRFSIRVLNHLGELFLLNYSTISNDYIAFRCINSSCLKNKRIKSYLSFCYLAKALSDICISVIGNHRTSNNHSDPVELFRCKDVPLAVMKLRWETLSGRRKRKTT